VEKIGPMGSISPETKVVSGQESFLELNMEILSKRLIKNSQRNSKFLLLNGIDHTYWLVQLRIYFLQYHYYQIQM
jgi:hypothetical protein